MLNKNTKTIQHLEDAHVTASYSQQTKKVLVLHTNLQYLHPLKQPCHLSLISHTFHKYEQANIQANVTRTNGLFN